MGKVLLAPLVMVLAAAAACGGTSGTSGTNNASNSNGGKPAKPEPASLNKAGVEQAISSKLATLQGQATKSVSCPQALRLTVNASTRCTLTTKEGETLPAIATVTSIQGATANLDVASPWVSKTLLGRLLIDELKERVTPAPKTVTCPRDLKSQVKATLTCTLTTTADTTHQISVTVTTVDDRHTEFDWSVKPVT